MTMARVPVDTRRRSFTDPAAGRTPINPRQIESAWATLGQAAESLHGAVDAALVDEGRELGEKDVSRDEDGNLQVRQPGFFGKLLPEHAEARRQAALAGYLAGAEKDIRENLTELRKKEGNRTNAPAFNTEAMAFARKMRDDAPPDFSSQVFNLATREAERVSRGIQRTAERVELQKQEGALRASLGEKENQMMALAR
ncbi:MAG: hypothetical protein ACLFV8_11915, partial [Alphaproteobacteria bacterium]